MSNRIGVFAALAVLVLGFGMLNLLYWTRISVGPGPGLYSYWSSSFGDSLMLPLLVYALTCLNLIGGFVARDNIVGIAVAIVGVVVGVLLQASWLSDPHPVTNWTLPRAGVFNFAGWYHAVFLTLTLSYSLGAFARGASRTADRLRRTSQDWRLFTIVILSSTLFGALLLGDNIRYSLSLGSVGTLVVVVVIAMVIVIALTVLVARNARQKKIALMNPSQPIDKSAVSNMTKPQDH